LKQSNGFFFNSNLKRQITNNFQTSISNFPGFMGFGHSALKFITPVGGQV